MTSKSTLTSLDCLMACVRPAWLAVTFFMVGTGGGLASVNHAKAQAYKPAMSLIPDTAAGVVRIPDVPALCAAWKSTTLSALLQDPAMQPFVETQKRLSEARSSTLGFNIGVRPKEVLEMASGEVVVAWLPFKDPRRPFALALIADIRGQRNLAEAVVKKVDADLRSLGATMKEVTFGGELIRVYTLKPVPGQIKIEQVAITFNDQRLIAADRDSVVTTMLETVSGANANPSLESSADYLGVRQQISSGAGATGPAQPSTAANQTPPSEVEWFARPIAMGRIVKGAANIDRGRQVDILNLLQRQGFDAVAAAGGKVVVGLPKFDLLHKGFVWAPPIEGQSERFRLAARVMQAVNNAPATAIPDWVSQSIASFSQLNWNLGDSFWHIESLVDDAFGEAIFRDILDGIRDDEDGPRIDIAKDVIPNLGTHVIILTDNVMPADQRSERMLVAIETTDTAALRKAVRRAMEVEPDATLVPTTVPGADVYRVLRTNQPNDFEAELFDDLGLGADDDPDLPPPLLNQWAITVMDDPAAIGSSGKKNGYLMFSSHPELLLDTIARFGSEKVEASFGSAADVQSVISHLNELGATDRAFVRIARTNLTFRAKYALMQEGKLRDSDSVLASLFRRIFISKDEEHLDLGNEQLPPFEQIEKYFRPAGGFSKATKLGWTLDGFLMK